MKKSTLIVMMLLLGGALFAQEQDKTFLTKKNEVKLNLPMTIFSSFPEISYERILQEDISVGASFGFSLNNDDSDDLKMQFSPYFRWFFGGSMESARKYAGGFFIEVNSAVYSYEEEEYDELLIGGTHEPNKESRVGAGLGLGFGWKFVSKNNWCGEILLGAGKDFAHSDNGYPRVGISIGKRF